MAAIDWVALSIIYLVVTGIVGVGLVGAVRNILWIGRLIWHNADTEEIIIKVVIVLSFVWVALRWMWKRLNKG